MCNIVEKHENSDDSDYGVSEYRERIYFMSQPLNSNKIDYHLYLYVCQYVIENLVVN